MTLPHGFPKPKARAICRVCGDPIRWARSVKTGGWMVLDRDPVPGGNVSLDPGSNYADGVPRATVVGHAKDLQGSVQLDFGGEERVLAYVAHQATCREYNERKGTKVWRE